MNREATQQIGLMAATGVVVVFVLPYLDQITVNMAPPWNNLLSFGVVLGIVVGVALLWQRLGNRR
jgi:ABC-type nickel/cobalt efflux system permease component RcnA